MKMKIIFLIVVMPTLAFAQVKTKLVVDDKSTVRSDSIRSDSIWYVSIKDSSKKITVYYTGGRSKTNIEDLNKENLIDVVKFIMDLIMIKYH
jgi:hypothetical protein